MPPIATLHRTAPAPTRTAGRRLRARAPWVLSATSLLLATGAPAQQSGDKPFFPPCPPFAEVERFDCYRNYEEMSAFLRDAADARPDRARLESMGRSWEGRELWVLTVTDFSAGEPGEKPALWVDGGIDADEVVAIEAALGLAHRLLTSEEPEIATVLRDRTFYIAPAVIPDASEIQHMTPVRPRDTTLRPWDDDGDGVLDEDGPDDLDGDGMALQMRRADPLGGWVADEDDPRLMRERRAGDTGPFYEVMVEGLDDDGDGEHGEDPVGGVDPNRNYPGNWSAGQGGSGPFPASELELRAMLDFILAHPNIAASQHFHSSGGVVLRPPSVPDLELPDDDLDLYLSLARRGLEVTGYDLATSVYDWNWPEGSRNRKTSQIWRDADGELAGPLLPGGDGYGRAVGGPGDGRTLHPLDGAGGGSAYPAFGGSIDGLYLLFGALAFANEIYAMGEDDDGDGRIEAHEQLRYDDEVLGGRAFAEWAPFEHPELGPVEIGGWRKFGHNNPPPEELPEEVRRNVDFALMQARSMPLLAVAEVEVEGLGGETWRVTATVENRGLQPTELAVRHERGSAVPVRVSAGGDGVRVLSSDGPLELEGLAGYGREEVSWVVRGEEGASVTVTAVHPKAGRGEGTATLR